MTTAQSNAEAVEESGADRDNLTYLADVLGTAMAERQAEGLIAGAGAPESGRGRELLAAIVAEAVERHAQLPSAVKALPEDVAALRAELAELRDQQGAGVRRLDELAATQFRQQETATLALEDVKATLSGLSKRLGPGLAEDLEAIEERIGRLADSTLLRERQSRRAMSFSALAIAVIALLVGLAVGAVAVAGSVPAALDALRGVVAG